MQGHRRLVPRKIGPDRLDFRLEVFGGYGDFGRVVPPRLEHMVIGEDVPRGIDQKATAEHMELHRPAAAFGGDDDISLAVDDRPAIRVNTCKFQPRATTPFVKPHNGVDETDTV